MDIVSIASIVGFVGDAVLQMLVKSSIGDWGLKEYFNQHGIFESMFIASGMLTIFFVIYIYVLRVPVTLFNLAVYGIVLDLFFRVTMLFPSLSGYYRHLNYFWSAVWGAIPMMLPLLLKF